MGHSERDCHEVAEEYKQERLGWSLGLKATPRKGRSKEVEEEKKYGSSKKVLFVPEVTTNVEAPGPNPPNPLIVAALINEAHEDKNLNASEEDAAFLNIIGEIANFKALSALNAKLLHGEETTCLTKNSDDCFVFSSKKDEVRVARENV